MNRIIKASIKRSITVCVLVVVLLAVGVLATMDMSTNLLPDIKLPMLGISVVYPGASAQSVDDGVTSKIDQALQTVPGITTLETMSYDNASVAVLTFDYGTNLDEKISAIQDAFKQVSFPEGCYEPSFIKIDMNGTATATISVYNAQGDIDALTRDAQSLASKLNGIEGVGSVSVLGTAEKQIRITALEGLDITALLIVQALTSQNMNIPLGTIMQDGTTVSIRNATDATSLLEIMQLPAQLSLGSSATNSFALLKSVVKEYVNCTLAEFDEHVNNAMDAKRVIEDIEGNDSAGLEEQQQGLVAIKSLVNLLRATSKTGLELMWEVAIEPIVSSDSFLSATDEDLHELANQYGISYDLIKWIWDNANDGTIQDDWNKLVEFRDIFPIEDTNFDNELNGYDITDEQFAWLFQDGNTVEIDGAKRHFDGLDILHSESAHQGCEQSCTRKTYTHAEAVDVCKFVDRVNLVAYADIVETVKDAEQKGESAVISDAQFAALFTTATQGNSVALMSPQVIHVIRLDNFYVEDDDTCIVNVLRTSKVLHVNSNGSPIYANGVEIALNDDGKQVVFIDDKEYFVNNFGRLVNADNKLVDGKGNILNLTDEQIQANYYSYGDYIVYTDIELAQLYQKIDLDLNLGITPTADVVRFVRICEFDLGSENLIVPLAFVGRIEFYDNNDAYAQYNGLMSVTIEVYAVSDANTTDVVNAIKNTLAGFNCDSVVVLLDDKAEFINDSISNVLTSIVIGGVLAVLVIYLFVRKIGSSLVVSITMPLSVLVALIGLWAMGITLNLVSLGGLAIGIGMLVDNSIVVLESITKRRDAGESIADSCLHGTREVAGSLLASTLTNVCVFFPILFARGLTREIFYDMVWAVLFSIVMSLVVAVTVIPSLYHLIYKNSPHFRHRKNKDGNLVVIDTCEANEPRSKENFAPIVENSTKKAQRNAKKQAKREQIKDKLNKVSISRLERGYGKILSKILTKRVLVCVVALVLFGASIALVFTTGTEFMPGVDKGVIEIDVDFDASTTLEQATSTSKQIADAVSDYYGDKLEYVAVTVGKQGIIATANSGIIRIQINNGALKTSETVQQIRELIAKQNLIANSVTVREMDGAIAEVTGGMSGQSVSLLSSDMDTLRRAAKAVADELRVADPQHIVSVVDNTPQLSNQISFTFDRMSCAERGVDYQTAVMLLRVGMSGYTAANVNIDGESMQVNVQFVDATKDNIDGLTNIVVGFDGNGAIKLSEVLKKTSDGKLYVTEEVASTIHKQDGLFFTSIDLEIYDIDSGTIGKTISKVVNKTLVDFDGVQYQEGGVASYLNDAFEGLVISLVAAFVLLYSVMACQFESLTKPFIVIMSIPFSFTGGFLALAITGVTLNVVSFVGLIMLMGVIVNGAIVMIDKISMLIDEGMEPQQAVIEGCKSRLRPILMTTLTTILALVPLALGLGRGGELMQPMGIVVLGGLLLGTLVTLVLIPCFYCIVKRISFTSIKASATAEQSNADIGQSDTDAQSVNREETTETNVDDAESVASNTDTTE